MSTQEFELSEEISLIYNQGNEYLYYLQMNQKRSSNESNKLAEVVTAKGTGVTCVISEPCLINNLKAVSVRDTMKNKESNRTG